MEGVSARPFSPLSSFINFQAFFNKLHLRRGIGKWSLRCKKHSINVCRRQYKLLLRIMEIPSFGLTVFLFNPPGLADVDINFRGTVIIIRCVIPLSTCLKRRRPSRGRRVTIFRERGGRVGGVCDLLVILHSWGRRVGGRPTLTALDIWNITVTLRIIDLEKNKLPSKNRIKIKWINLQSGHQ